MEVTTKPSSPVAASTDGEAVAAAWQPLEQQNLAEGWGVP
jgi:hypothetical protein